MLGLSQKLLLAPAWALAEAILASQRRRLGGRYALLHALLTGLVFTAWDLYLDPQVVARGLWVWDNGAGGGYFGIPWVNFLGWWLSAALLSLIVRPTLVRRPRLMIIYTLTWAFQALGLPAYSVISPTTWGYDEEAAQLYRFNLDEAQRLLEEAGWADANGDGIREKDGQNLTIDWPDYPAWSEAFNELVSGYLTNAGFEVNYRSMDDGAQYEELLAGNYTLVYMYWTRPDPSPLRYLFHSENIGGGAWTNFKSDELDQVLADADTNTDEAARKQDYQRAQQIIMENALALPMFTVNTSYLVDLAVQGFTLDLEGYPFLYDMSLAQ